MWPDKTVPITEAEIDFKYDWAVCREGDRIVQHGPSITYKGNGIGWSYNNPNNVIKNIIELKRPMTWKEEAEYTKAEFKREKYKKANQLNLYGLYNDCYIQGEHEMYNGWVEGNFYRMCKNLNEEKWTIVGIAEPPYGWSLDDPCMAIIVEDLDSNRFWCHTHKSWIQDMREDMIEEYQNLTVKED